MKTTISLKLKSTTSINVKKNVNFYFFYYEMNNETTEMWSVKMEGRLENF